MKVPNWFKVSWWILLTGVLTYFLFCRYPDLIAGKAAAADVVVFVVWIALLLAPIFSEVSLLGITLKQQIDDLRGFVAAQVSDIRSEVKNAVDIRTTFSPHFHMPDPVPDGRLAELENKIKSVLLNVEVTQGVPASAPTISIAVPENAAFLFAARYNIEIAVQEIAKSQPPPAGLVPRSYLPVAQIVRSLVESRLLEPQLAGAIQEAYAVCSAGVHGEPVTDAQIAFVKDVVPGLVAVLRGIKGRLSKGPNRLF